LAAAKLGIIGSGKDCRMRPIAVTTGLFRFAIGFGNDHRNRGSSPGARSALLLFALGA
jgi:hypothetical protein